MTENVASNFTHRDRSIEIVEKSAAIRSRLRVLREEGQSAAILRDEVGALLDEAAAAGISIASAANRTAVEYEIGLWRRWFADELGEYYPPVELEFSQITEEKLRKLDYPNLMILLRQGEPISGRLVESIEFAKHVDEVREAFGESKLINCRFEKCKFDGAQFGAGTKLVYVTFSECSLDYFFWPNVRASSLAFEDLNIRAAGFESGTFADVLFREFHGDRMIFIDANFTYCKFDGVEITGTNFSGTIFSKCIFNRTLFAACDFSDSVFSECEFVDATVAGGSLRGTLITKCDLSSLRLTKGPPRAGDASRRLQVDTDLSNIQVKDSVNMPQSIAAHLFVQDFANLPDDVSHAEDSA